MDLAMEQGQRVVDNFHGTTLFLVQLNLFNTLQTKVFRPFLTSQFTCIFLVTVIPMLNYMNIVILRLNYCCFGLALPVRSTVRRLSKMKTDDIENPLILN